MVIFDDFYQSVVFLHFQRDFLYQFFYFSKIFLVCNNKKWFRLKYHFPALLVTFRISQSTFLFNFSNLFCLSVMFSKSAIRFPMYQPIFPWGWENWEKRKKYSSKKFDDQSTVVYFETDKELLEGLFLLASAFWKKK